MYKLLLSIIVLFSPFFAIAQTANDIDFFASWRADAYVEPTYAGRIFPSYGTPVEASFELLDAGKPVNLTNRIINWVLDGAPLQSGAGLQKIKFSSDPLRAGSEHNVRIVVPDYKGADRVFNLTIPVRRPEVVIKTPFFRAATPPGSHVLSALLFYWNTADPDGLFYEWSLNGARAESAGPTMALTIPPNAPKSTLRLTLKVGSSSNELESAATSVSLVIK
jgi:hypothetical protein